MMTGSLHYVNIITLCEYHHKLADAGAISKETLHEIAIANNA